tara:strand:- start:951 stop:1466 length:516 start_codon:yes stop_codon:yes gene_type:complete
MNIIGNCPLCEEKSLHIIGESETQTQQCINCGYVTAEKFKLDGIEKEKHQEYKNLTKDMKGWVKIENDRIWIPTIMTLPIGMLYPQNVDNLVNHKTEMKWHFAEMVEIKEEEKENYKREDGEGFYNKRIDTDNAKMYETFLEGMAEVNSKLKEQQKPKPTKVKLPKLKKIK